MKELIIKILKLLIAFKRWDLDYLFIFKNLQMVRVLSNTR